MRARKVVDELSTLQSALLELSAAFELEPQHATEGGAATEEGGKKGDKKEGKGAKPVPEPPTGSPKEIEAATRIVRVLFQSKTESGHVNWTLKANQQKQENL